MATLQPGDRVLQPGHGIVQWPGVARLGCVAPRHGQALGVADGEPGPLDLLLGVLGHVVEAAQPVTGRGHGLVRRVQQGPYGGQPRRRIGPALLVPRLGGLLELLLGLPHIDRGLLGHGLEVLPAGSGEPPPQLAQHRLHRAGARRQRLGSRAQRHQPVVDLRGALGKLRRLGPHGLGAAQHLIGALQRLRYAVPAGALVELGQFGGEGRQACGEIVRPQSGRARRVESIARTEERLSRPFDCGREPGELRLGIPQERTESLREPFQFALDPHELVLGGGQLRPGTRRDRRLKIVAIEVVGVDRRDVRMAGLVDPPPQRGEIVHDLPRGGRAVHRGDRLDRDLQIALSRVQLVEGLRGRVLRRLRIGTLVLPATAEPAPRTTTGEGGRQRRGEQRHRQQHQAEDVPDGGSATRSCLWPRVCRRHIPLPCRIALPGSFSHQVRTNTRAR